MSISQLFTTYEEAVTEWSYHCTARSVRWVTASGAVPSGVSGAAVAWPLPDGSVSGLRGEQAAGFVFSADVLSFLSGSERHWLVG